MITSIFNKSKPINFLIVFFIILIPFVFSRIFSENHPEPVVFAKESSLFLLHCLSIFILHFIVNKNTLTQKTGYAILLYGLLLATLSNTTLNIGLILANIFILLAIRRVVSLRTGTNIKKKLFDAGLWIAVASGFNSWAILFFLLIPISLLFYADNNIKHWVVPFLGAATVVLLSACYSIIYTDSYFDTLSFNYNINLNIASYTLNTSLLVSLVLLILISTWASFHYLNIINKRLNQYRASLYLIFLAAIIGLGIIIISPIKNGSEWLFSFAPLSVIIANYVESISKKWFQETFLYIVILLPIVSILL